MGRRSVEWTLDPRSVGSALVAVALVGISYAIVEVRRRGLSAVLPFLSSGSPRYRSCRMDVALARSRDPAGPASPAGSCRRESRHARDVRGARGAPALPARLPPVPGVLADACGARVLAAEPGTDPPRAPLRPLRDRNGPRVPIAVGAATIGLAMLLLLPVSNRSDAWTGCRERLPLRNRFAGGRRADHRRCSRARSGGSRRSRRGSQPDRRPCRRHSPSPRSEPSQVVVRPARRHRGHAVRPLGGGLARAAGVDTFRGVVLCVAGLAFLASALAATFLAAIVRGARPRV